MSQHTPPDPPPLPSDSSNALPTQPRRWQFSLQTMLKGITIFAILCGFGAILPVAFSQIILGAFWIAISGWLITGIVFAKGDKRAFCIGAAVVATSMWTRVGGKFIQGISDLVTGLLGIGGLNNSVTLDIWIEHIGLAAAAIANGWLCIKARRYFEQP